MGGRHAKCGVKTRVRASSVTNRALRAKRALWGLSIVHGLFLRTVKNQVAFGEMEGRPGFASVFIDIFIEDIGDGECV